MANKITYTIANSLSILWTIASKDIVDALKNKVIISMIITLSIILLVPKLLPLIFEQGQTVLPILDIGNSRLTAELKKTPELSVQQQRSEQELKQALCSALFPGRR